ncbi:MAG: four helix bundle protein [Flavihumibacter sp.]
MKEEREYGEYEDAAFDGSGSFVEEDGKPYNIRHQAFMFARDLINWIKTIRYEKPSSSLFEQLVRSGSSVGANLVEGKSGASGKDWAKFQVIALKSANETKYWLCLIRDTQPVDLQQVNQLITEADAISKIIASTLLRYRGNQ